MVSPVMTSMNSLSEKELEQAKNYAAKIDLNNTAVIMQYAAPVQRKITNYSSQALEIASSQSTSEALDVINQLIEIIRSFAATKKGLFGLGKMTQTDWRTAYQSASQTISQLSLRLEQIQFELYKDMGLYQQMAKRNQEAKRELLLYQEAGKLRLDMAKERELPKLLSEKAEGSAQANLQLSHYQGAVAEFEKKLQDLQVSRLISEQFDAQLKLMYETAHTLSDKLQSTISHTIPLWQNQVAIALGLDRIRQATEAERLVRETEFVNPSEQISELTSEILQDMNQKKTELEEAGP